jgi:hypothetical protein
MENNIVWIAEITDKNFCCNGCRGTDIFRVFSSERTATDWAITHTEKRREEIPWTEFEWEVYALTLDQPNA